jgi:hypothetical protein
VAVGEAVVAVLEPAAVGVARGPRGVTARLVLRDEVAPSAARWWRSRIVVAHGDWGCRDQVVPCSCSPPRVQLHASSPATVCACSVSEALGTLRVTVREKAPTEVYLEADPLKPADDAEPDVPYLEVASATVTPLAARARARASERPSADDGGWRAVLDALLADKPLLLALWPTAVPAQVLLSPPSEGVFRRRVDDVLRGLDELARRGANDRAFAEAAHRRLSDHLARLPGDHAARLERLRHDVVLFQEGSIRDFVRRLQQSLGEIGTSDLPRFDTYGTSLGIASDRVRAILYEEGVLAREEPVLAAKGVTETAPQAAGIEGDRDEQESLQHNALRRPDPPIVAAREARERADSAATLERSQTPRRRPAPAEWRFEHLGPDYFEPIVAAHRSARLSPIAAIWTGRTGVAYALKKRGRKVRPNWMVELEDGRTFTTYSGFEAEDAFQRSQMYRWSWEELTRVYPALRAPMPEPLSPTRSRGTSNEDFERIAETLASDLLNGHVFVPASTSSSPTSPRAPTSPSADRATDQDSADPARTARTYDDPGWIYQIVLAGIVLFAALIVMAVVLSTSSPFDPSIGR